jgi:outer membrane protein TolC
MFNKTTKTAILGTLVGWAFSPETTAAADTMRLSHQECVEIALKNNRIHKISEYDIRIAEALLKQAKSAYWPSLSAGLTAGILDDPLVFTYPSSTLTTPDMAIATPFGTIPVAGQTIDIPSQKIDIMDREVLMASLNLKYPLYAGGKIKAVNAQAKFGVEAALQGARRSELEVERDIDRVYYGAVMGRKLVKISNDTLQRMEATLELTKRLYEAGSGTVKKTDYLRNKTVVEMIRSVNSSMRQRQTQADTALVNLMGLDRGVVVEPTVTDLPRGKDIAGSNELIMLALDANPDLARVRAGIGAATARIAEARSGYKPKVGLFAKYVHLENELDTGLMDPQNQNIGMIGIGATLPLFEGFRTKNNVLEARLNLDKLRMQEQALSEGIGLQIEHAYAELNSALEREVSTGDGLKAATENRDLNTRAYQEELVETEDVIQAQFMEAFLDVSYQKTLYEIVEARAKLNFLVGSETEAAASTPL